MVRSQSAGESEDPEFELPENAAHVIVCGDQLGAAAPEGYPEDTRLTYEFGDELPFGIGEKAIEKHPRTLVAIDENGEPVYGGESSNSPLGTLGSSQSRDVEGAVRTWRNGDGFDPSVYGEE